MNPVIWIGISIAMGIAMIVVISLLVGDGNSSIESAEQENRQKLFWPDADDF